MTSYSVVGILTLVLCHSAARAYDLMNRQVAKFESCSLAEYSTLSVTDSEIGCAAECLTKHHDGGCAAFQWNAETGSCRMQEKQNITTSDGNTVWVLLCGLPSDCSAILSADPNSRSGIYFVSTGMLVWCDMFTDGGGWTVFLKRLDGSVVFYLDFDAYQKGFGNVSGEYWLGLDALHTLTSSNTYELRADISDWEGASVYSLYGSMLIASEQQHYKLTLGAFLEGEGGDPLNRNNGTEFSARDHDRDWHDGWNCAERMHGGFWYRSCTLGNPTGRYYINGTCTKNPADGIKWRQWNKHAGRGYSMKTVEMKIRP